jgi:hypothetical protein
MGVLTGARTQHRYQTCRHESCERFACRVYRDGYGRGFAEGEAIGHAEGYSQGYAAGAAAAGKE